MKQTHHAALNRPSRILIVNPFGIGDVLFSMALIRALRQAFPHAHLAYLCNRRTEQILQRNTHLDELFVYEKDEFIALWRTHRRSGLKAIASLIRQIRARRFEMVLDLSLGERYSFVLAWLGVARRIGFDFRNRGRFLTHRFGIDGYQGEHVVEHYARLLRWIGICADEHRHELAINELERQATKQWLAQLGCDAARPTIGLVPAGGISWGGQAHFRRWSQEGFVQVGQALRRQRQATILVLGESQDHQICAEIAGAIGSGAIDLSGQTTLTQFIALVGCCDLVVANDGGPIHIAASQDTRTVSIFGPVDPHVYGPYPQTSRHRIVYNEALPCRPCYHQFKLPSCPYERACLTTIDPQDVLEACEAVLQE